MSDPKTLEEQKVFIKGCVCSNLVGHVDSDFGIWSNGIADCRTLGEQAVFIDCCLTVASKDDRPQKMQYDPKVLQASLAEMPLPSIFWFDEPDSKT